jgi:hypothetical protein
MTSLLSLQFRFARVLAISWPLYAIMMADQIHPGPAAPNRARFFALVLRSDRQKLFPSSGGIRMAVIPAGPRGKQEDGLNRIGMSPRCPQRMCGLDGEAAVLMANCHQRFRNESLEF